MCAKEKPRGWRGFFEGTVFPVVRIGILRVGGKGNVEGWGYGGNGGWGAGGAGLGGSFWCCLARFSGVIDGWEGFVLSQVSESRRGAAPCARSDGETLGPAGTRRTVRLRSVQNEAAVKTLAAQQALAVQPVCPRTWAFRSFP